jgi:transient receptor potential cation channel subfamily A member 1
LLHISIDKGHSDCVIYLLNKGADSTIKNKRCHAPIHQCVISNKPDILDILLSHEKKCDIHLGGENGGTALHYCAYYDNLECAKILLKYDASLCNPDNNGFLPIHMAAQRCSNKVLEYLIEEANKKGCSRLKMLSFVDGDNNKPLHAAVQFGNLGAVKLCLENGASIDEVIDIDNSTPVHVACAQGSLEILRLMAEKQPDLFLEVLHSQDNIQMTPLHKAAMFDHLDVAKYLLEKGAYIDALDKEKRSPMLLAATRNCIKVVCFFLSQGANVKLKDSKLRNLLHLIIDQEFSSNVSNGNLYEQNEKIGQFKMSTSAALEKISHELFKVPVSHYN